MKHELVMTAFSKAQRTRFTAALQRVGGDEEILIMLAQIVAEDAPPMLAKLETQLNENQLDAAAKSAHALKGLLSTFETGTPVEELQQLIDEARLGQGRTATAMLNKLRPSLDTLVSQVKELTEES
ncbi:Hpt domain-containing protein [Novipirellula galeiformis]|nr:Hpt domain-containing protein [Novipirellula galeiformis]